MPAERSEVIAGIRNRLKAGEPVPVVSTQLVEAGVDIDFPVVYRAMAGLDSIAQAAGRCNREGKLNAQGRLGEVVVFDPPRSSPPGLLRKGEDTCRAMLRLEPGLVPGPEAFTGLPTLLLGGQLISTAHRFVERLQSGAREVKLQFRTAGAAFPPDRR